MAGCSLVVVGVLSLSLSAAAAQTGSWWQSTLDAFGVGFTVAGIVDAVAITLMNSYLTATQVRWTDRAEQVLDQARSGFEVHYEAKTLLQTHRDDIDWQTMNLLAKYASGYVFDVITGELYDPLVRRPRNDLPS